MGASSFIARVGHLCLSSRVLGRILEAMTGIIESSFRFRKALRMPAQAGVWTEHARKILSLTQCAMDLSLEQKTEILRYDNGSWDTNDIVHWCLPDCPCGGSRQGALLKTKAAVMMSLGAGCEFALEYR